jgi:thiol-disulfide isomerase/thioredoxin
MDYKLKYEKYKIKYFTLKNKLNINNQNGGSSNKPTLYLFKAEWCGHCKQFKDDWDKLQGNSELKKKVNFVTMDSDKNKKEIEEWKVEGFPTLILKTGNKAIEYSDNRTVEHITEFLNKNIN